MVSLKEIEQLVRKSRENNVKIVIRFKRCKGKVLIYREVRALDESDNIVPWGKVFPVPPDVAIDSCIVKSIEVLCNNDVVMRFETWDQLIRSLDSIPRCTTTAP